MSGPGGDAGAGTAPAGLPGVNMESAGGGGGAVGRVRINGTTLSVDGLVSPALSTGAFTTATLRLASD